MPVLFFPWFPFNLGEFFSRSLVSLAAALKER
jgi:hypothetical protein